MNHDISHCDAEIAPGELCTRRHTCIRFIAHEDLLTHPIPYRFYLTPYECVYNEDPYHMYVHLDVK